MASAGEKKKLARVKGYNEWEKMAGREKKRERIKGFLWKSLDIFSICESSPGEEINEDG